MDKATHRSLWKQEDVQGWLARQVTVPLTSTVHEPPTATTPPRRRRGRPTKVEQRAHSVPSGGSK
jgi:hypothetical protein